MAFNAAVDVASCLTLNPLPPTIANLSFVPYFLISHSSCLHSTVRFVYTVREGEGEGEGQGGQGEGET